MIKAQLIRLQTVKLLRGIVKIGSSCRTEWGIRYEQQTLKSGHRRPLTNDRGGVSHFCCLLCGENVNCRLFKVKKEKTLLYTCPPCPPSIHPSILPPPSPPMQWLVPWNWGQGTNGGPCGLVCLWKQPPPHTHSLLSYKSSRLIESGRVLWCPSHVSFQSPSEGSHGSTFTHWAQGRCVWAHVGRGWVRDSKREGQIEKQSVKERKWVWVKRDVEGN